MILEQVTASDDPAVSLDSVKDVSAEDLPRLVAALTVHHLRLAGNLDTVPQGTQLEIPDEAYEVVGV